MNYLDQKVERTKEERIKAIAFAKYMRWITRNMFTGNSQKLQDMREIKKVIAQAKEEAKQEYYRKDGTDYGGNQNTDPSRG